jgi:Holliday junction DNA helicase RuvA
MIATLTGLVNEKLGEVIVIDVNGVGYGLLVTTEDYGHLAVGDKTKLYVYEHIRENSHDLFGFLTLDTKQLFEQLLDVNGVGPKMAISILSVGSSTEVRQAIASGDTKFIQAAPGVGKRVTERVVVELKDKVGLVAAEGIEALLISTGVAQKDEAVQALISLGYTIPDALTALASVDTGLPTEERVKIALKGSTR